MIENQEEKLRKEEQTEQNSNVKEEVPLSTLVKGPT